MKKLPETQIIDLYKNGLSLERIAKMFNVSSGPISRIVKKAGGMRTPTENSRKYPIDENFFDQIDTPEKAYFLGILLADGSNNGKNQVSLRLHIKDLSILEKLNNLFQPNKPIYHYTSEINKNRKKAHTCGFLSICSARISENLSKWGIVKNKTFITQFPDWLPDELVRHFLRGLFDGDGCYSDRTALVVGTKNLCLGIQKAVERILGILGPVRPLSADKPNIFYFSVRRLEHLKLFLGWMYEGSTLYMERKYQTVQEILSYVTPIRKERIKEDGSIYTEEEWRERAKIRDRGYNKAKTAKRREQNKDNPKIRSNMLINEDGTPFTIEQKKERKKLQTIARKLKREGDNSK